MLTFRQFAILLEDKIDFLKNTNPGLEKEIDHYSSLDPTPNKAYLNALVNWHKKGQISTDTNPEDLKNTLNNFKRYSPRLDQKDINRYASPADLDTALAPHVGQVASNREKRRQDKEEGSELIHNENGVSVRRIDTQAASNLYGAGTKWCTTNKGAAEQNLTGSKFDDYIKKGSLYIINTPEGKFQVHHDNKGEVKEFRDEADKAVPIDSIVDRYPEIANAFKNTPHARGYQTNTGNYMSSDDIQHGLSSDNVDDRIEAVKNVNATPEHLAQALTDEDPNVRKAALNHRNINGEHIKRALQDPEYAVRMAAIKNPNVTPKNIDDALDSDDINVRQGAIWHKNATSDNLTKALMHPDEGTRMAATYARGFGDDEKHFDLATNEYKDNPKAGYRLQSQVLDSKKLTPKYIDKLLDSSNPYIRRGAAKHQNASPDNINKALDDSDQLVRENAVDHPNASRENLLKATNDQATVVNYRAERKLKKMNA